VTASSSSDPSPAFYASSAGGWRDWWTLLHPPYTLWNLSYVAIGSALAPRFSLWRLAETLAAFFLALGISAHALDELKDRPLRTQLSDRTLMTAASAGLVGAAALGYKGVIEVGAGLLPFIGIGMFAVLAYNLEWFGGRFHTDAAFAAFWGGFPVLVGYYFEAQRLDPGVVLVAVAAFGFSLAQRVLSTEARFLRRRVHQARLEVELSDGEMQERDRFDLLLPFDAALWKMSWAMAALAAGLVIARVGG
jgi:hypothetical protein